MMSSDLLTLLQAFYKDTLDLVLARQANARSVAAYDANNAYQQILGRQDVHLRWLADAIAAEGGTADDPPFGAASEPSKGLALKDIAEADAQAQRAFLARWQPQLASVTNARHRKMLGLVLGEMNEHLRMLDQALEGRTDLLGRHAAGKVLAGSVIADRPRG